MTEHFKIKNGVLLEYRSMSHHSERLVIPDGVTEIADHAISCSMRQTTVVIPETVRKIGVNNLRFPVIFIKYAGKKYSLYQVFHRSEAFRMIAERKLSADLSREEKFYILMQMLIFCPEDKKLTEYLRRKSYSSGETFRYLIEKNQPAPVRILLERNIFRMKRQTDALIAYANQKKAYEIQLMLTDYKFRQMDFLKPEDKLKLE